MGSDGVQELGENRRVEIARALLDQPQPEMDMPEQAPFLGLAKSGATSELANAADVVQERGAEQEVGPEPGMELRGLAAERRDARPCARGDHLRSRGARRRRLREALSSPSGSPRSRTNEPTTEASPGWAISSARNSKKPSSSSASRRSVGRELGGIGVVHRLDRPHLHLQPPAEALDASQDAHRVAFAESLVEKLDVAPDPRLDATARVRELEREVRRAGLGAPPLLLGDREHALHGPVLGELGDRGHGSGV